MSKSVTLDNLGLNITELIEKYSTDVKERAEKELDETADKILDYIKEKCPRSGYGSNHLADSFVKTEKGSGVNVI